MKLPQSLCNTKVMRNFHLITSFTGFRYISNNITVQLFNSTRSRTFHMPSVNNRRKLNFSFLTFLFTAFSSAFGTIKLSANLNHNLQGRKIPLLFGVLAIVGLLFGFLLYRSIDASYSTSQSIIFATSGKDLPNLTGEKAVSYLKETGEYDSLAGAMTAARYKAEETKESEGVWYLLRSNQGFTALQFGIAEDIPQPADFDGEGQAELVVYRPSEGNWYVLNLLTGQFSVVQFGNSTDKPVVGDYDGDNRADYDRVSTIGRTLVSAEKHRRVHGSAVWDC